MKFYSAMVFSLILSLGSLQAAGFGDGGCGLGSVLFGDDNGKGSQILAATTNGTFGTQTFGITSGTSNCVDNGGSAHNFIESNRVALLNDAARGSGETIEALSSLYGCDNSAHLGQNLQSNFDRVFDDSKTSVQIDSEIRGLILKSSDLASSCQIIG